jgi:hypothetical protein
MDAWWPKLVEAQFGPALGDDAMEALRTMLSYAGSSLPGTTAPAPPEFSDGWFSYVSKDLRGLFRPQRVRGLWSRAYCGRGSRSRCRRALRASLLDALEVERTELYGREPCTEDPDAACFDMNRFTVASGVDVPDFPFQNRPTFQQTVEIQRRIGR